MQHFTWIEIDLQQFKKNLFSIQQKLQKVKFCLPVKADAYGHGILEVAKVAQDVGVNYLGVSCLAEGKLLREQGIIIPILVFGAVHEMQITDLIEYGLEFTISSLYKAKFVAAYCEKHKKKCAVHLEIDTGMQRTGVRPSTFWDLFHFIKESSYFHIKGIYSQVLPLKKIFECLMGRFGKCIFLE